MSHLLERITSVICSRRWDKNWNLQALRKPRDLLLPLEETASHEVANISQVLPGEKRVPGQDFCFKTHRILSLMCFEAVECQVMTVWFNQGRTNNWAIYSLWQLGRIQKTISVYRLLYLVAIVDCGLWVAFQFLTSNFWWMPSTSL